MQQYFYWEHSYDFQCLFPHFWSFLQSEISDLCVSPDNEWLASGSCDCTVRVWSIHHDDDGASASASSAAPCPLATEFGPMTADSSLDSDATLVGASESFASASNSTLPVFESSSAASSAAPLPAWTPLPADRNRDRQIHLGAPVAVLRGHTRDVMRVAFAPRWSVCDVPLGTAHTHTHTHSPLISSGYLSFKVTSHTGLILHPLDSDRSTHFVRLPCPEIPARVAPTHRHRARGV